MKTQLRKLRLLAKVFDLEDFYCVTARTGGIDLQGKFKKEIVVLCKKLKFAESFSDNGYAQFNRSNIEITLT